MTMEQQKQETATFYADEEQKPRHTVLYVREFDVLMAEAKKELAQTHELVALSIEYRGEMYDFTEAQLLKKLGIKH